MRTTFNFARKGFNAELLHRVSATIRGSAQALVTVTLTRVFDEQRRIREKVTIDRVFPRVRLSEFSWRWHADTSRHDYWSRRRALC